MPDAEFVYLSTGHKPFEVTNVINPEYFTKEWKVDFVAHGWGTKNVPEPKGFPVFSRIDALLRLASDDDSITLQRIGTLLIVPSSYVENWPKEKVKRMDWGYKVNMTDFEHVKKEAKTRGDIVKALNEYGYVYQKFSLIISYYDKNGCFPPRVRKFETVFNTGGLHNDSKND